MEITQNENHPAVSSQPLPSKPKPSYFTKLFTGRLNRQNYILGSTFFVLVPLLCFLIVIFNILLSPSTFALPYLDTTNPGGHLVNIVTPQVSLASLLGTTANEIWSAIGIIFMILSLPYLFSLQIKRLHDLNLSGWLWTVNIFSLASLFVLPIPGVTNPNPTWFVTANVLSLAATVFSFYVTLWPGTKGPNKYGEPPPPRSSFLGDIMAVR